MQLFQLVFPERVNLAGGIPHLDRKSVFIHAGAGNLAAVPSGDAHLQKVVGDHDIPAILSETFGDIRLRIEQGSAQVVWDTPPANSGKVRSERTAFAADRVALGAARFPVYPLTPRATGGGLERGVTLQAPNKNHDVANFPVLQRSRWHFRAWNTFLDNVEQRVVTRSALRGGGTSA